MLTPAATVAAVLAVAATTIGRPPWTASTPHDVAPVAFAATTEPIGADLAEEMTGVSWHPGCPVSIADLVLIRMPHWGFDGEQHWGELVVHRVVAADAAHVFAEAYDERFPIRRMERIESYAGDDEASMAADNTSAFNCRSIAGTDSVSVHSWGLAIDINTLENPYVRSDVVQPPDGVEFLDRSDVRPGMIVDGDLLVTEFAAVGFDWGGHWTSLKDYQHFEAPDRAEPSEPADEVAPGHGRPCAAVPPDSSAWTGDVSADGGVAEFNAFLADAGVPIADSPCDAARVLLGVDRQPDAAERSFVTVRRAGDATTDVEVLVDQLADDSTAAVRHELVFDHRDDGTIRLADATHSWRCQPGRGHQEFTTELCV